MCIRLQNASSTIVIKIESGTIEKTMKRLLLLWITALFAGFADADIIYSNDFTGAVGNNPGLVAAVNPNLNFNHTGVALDGAGHLVSAVTGGSPSVFRVQLSESALTAPEIKLTATMRAMTSGSWIGAGFQSENVLKLNNAEANTGPWFFITSTAVTVLGGTGAGNPARFNETHTAGDLLTFEMTYHTETQTLDLSLNGSVVAAGMPVIHEYPIGTQSEPVVRYLQIQFQATALNDTGYFDRLVVEVKPDGIVAPSIKLAQIFSDGCVLQRDQTVTVQGSGCPHEAITVKVKDQIKPTVADANGKWQVQLDPEPAGGPFTMTAAGERSLPISPAVYFGDVWILTGQSNMFQPLNAQVSNFPGIYPAVPNATDDFDDIRFAIVDIVADSNTPAKDGMLLLPWSRWQADKLSDMSTVGYFFARFLKELMDAGGSGHVPLGFIKVCKGGTGIEQWISAEALAAMGEPLITDKRTPATVYYNGMIAPIQNYAIKGVLWYQGESNARTIERIEQYPLLFRTLVESWRAQWGIDFPFYYVQLAPYMKYAEVPTDDDASSNFKNWAWMRESQAECLSLSNTAMACIIDSGFQGDIHPPYKDRVGERLARIAAADSYGIDVVSRGPTVADTQIKGAEVVITFDHVADGLRTQAVDAQPDAEEVAAGLPAVSVSSDELAGFALCGHDRVFYWADSAEIISSNQVRISNTAKVPEPVAVRYAWQSYPRCNLFNSERLPAEPFRTDKYEYMTSSEVSELIKQKKATDRLIPGDGEGTGK